MTRLVSAKRVTVQRIPGPPADSCRPELVAPSDTIACYPATSVNRAPKGKWVQQVLKLSAPWAWVRGRSGLDPMFAPAFGLHFQGDSLNVDWILSLEPMSAMIRIGGVISASAVVPEEDHVQLLELMRHPFPKDRELVARHIIEEERHEPQAGPGEEPQRIEDAEGVSYEGCDCWDPVRGEPSKGLDVRRTRLDHTRCFDETARPVVAPPPVYPEFAKEARVQGTVYLRVLVSANGRVENIKVLRGITGLTDAALDSIHRWVFKPATKSGDPVCIWIEVPVDFRF